MSNSNYQKKPEWLKVKIQNPKNLSHVNTLIQSLNLNTVCHGANCPNRLECFSKSTATFMILGSICSRHCRFCNIESGKLLPPDIGEPYRVATAVKELGLKHAVITSVTRDDLEDGGAQMFAQTIIAIREASPDTTIEVLIPDFKGSFDALKTVMDAKPHIINHNVETVNRLYADIRPEADYTQSLELLASVKAYDESIFSKSGFMLGLGEEEEEVLKLIEDLRAVSVDILTIGQYLPPSDAHAPLISYITPEKFTEYGKYAQSIGISSVASSPLVRSSYNAKEVFDEKNTNL
ncbi:lipoyl synthase [Fusibacter bizertensis]|uniref:Lipoyl synthase n=1 Tax=Fusibacter bizertensis TaxID=1488331 RepID=A0ABT6NCQ5_9FIRM|nr:lipoyl synthase [Fusibacter bizertensis]MDH8678204.1 lipoyl synthase [Fusibacter bizertensis]